MRDPIADAATKARRIVAAVAARRLLARGVKNDVIRTKIEGDQLTDAEIEALAGDVFEACAIAVRQHAAAIDR